MGRIRVVIADDSRLARDLLRAIFEAEPGMEVVGEASNGREAVALVQQLRPHLVTMDLEMPLMDGVAAVEEIMCTRAVPILVVSSVADAPRSLQRAWKLPAAIDAAQSTANLVNGVLTLNLATHQPTPAVHKLVIA